MHIYVCEVGVCLHYVNSACKPEISLEHLGSAHEDEPVRRLEANPVQRAVVARRPASHAKAYQLLPLRQDAGPLAQHLLFGQTTRKQKMGVRRGGVGFFHDKKTTTRWFIVGRGGR